jgi:hypothetical protein
MSRDPATFEFTNEEREKINEELTKKEPELSNKDINLKTDLIKVSGQNYALISFICNETRQKHDKMCLKIKGVFETIDQANTHAKKCMEEDPSFDVYVVSLYEWLGPFPPDLKHIPNQEYIDEELNTMISEYKKSQELNKMEFEYRKEGLKNNPDLNTLVKDVDIPPRVHFSVEKDDEGVEESKEES